MAFTGVMHISPGAFTAVDSAASMAVGTRATDGSGNEFVYLQGVASTAVGSWVTFDEAGVTALLAADAKGQVAVALAATIANTYGWYQVSGSGVGLTADDVADNGDVYATATAGSADDAIVAGDRVKGAWFRAAGTGASSVVVQLANPYVDDIAD